MSQKEMIAKTREIYYMDEFRAFMRKMQGATDEDFKQPVESIKESILASRETDPLEMFFSVFEKAEQAWTATETLPVNIEWHHFIVPGVILTALRNNGYPVSDADIMEAMKRGDKFAGGSCGFMGTCGGAYSVGIVGSLIKKTNPLHDEGRREIMHAAAGALQKIAEVGRRCCKRSSYAAFEAAGAFLSENGYNLTISEIKCRYNTKNKMCAGSVCPYHPMNLK